jgi:branched-subunit amino acid transport protein
MWAAILIGSFGCYALKLTGLSVPERVLDDRRVRRISELLPIALLAALIGTQTFATGRHLEIDARFAGLIVAIVLVWRRAPFLVVVFGAAAAAAILRALA